MRDSEVVYDLILKGIEDENVDFKQSYYSKDKRGDLIKDICAFANNGGTNDKYIIFGIENSPLIICGIEGDLEDVSCINQLLEENVEPFINVSVGSFDFKGKCIGYIKIYENNDRPYVIKKEFSKGVFLKKGDVYIRKGATVFRATRNDLDLIYSKKCRKEVSLCDDYLYIGNMHMKGKDDFSAGTAQLKFTNESDMSITFNVGYITLENDFGRIERMLFNPEGIPRLDENPYELEAKVQKVVNFHFEFESSDCIRLNFDEDGNMIYSTRAKITLIDIEGNEYTCAYKTVSLKAKGNILHKIKRKFKSFRDFLIQEQNNLMFCIDCQDKNGVEKILNQGAAYFELIQPPYVLNNVTFPEYKITYQLIVSGLRKDKGIVELFEKQNLSQEFIKFCQARIEQT